MKKRPYVDTELLEEYMKGMKKSYLAECMGMSPQSFSNKVNGRYPFSIPEVFMLCYLLHIDDDNIKSKIFYPQGK